VFWGFPFPLTMLVLLIGDLHIPHRAMDLPSKFKKLLVPGKIQQILSTGNLCNRETYDYLRTIAPEICAVRGDMDEFIAPTNISNIVAGLNSPTSATSVTSPSSVQNSQPVYSKVVVYGNIRVGLLHGHQCLPWGDTNSLLIAARQMDVDVLVSGHSHQFHAFENQGRFFVNPGSATGCMATTMSMVPNTVDDAAEQDVAVSDENRAPTSTTATTAAVVPDGTQKPKTVMVYEEPVPSFVLMDVQPPSTIILYIYKLLNGDVKVEKMEYHKK
jgi:vacuolar protein sorting-associated protein 29